MLISVLASTLVLSMKIKSVKILGDNFRSLKADKLHVFNESKNKDRLSTKIFAGLNGSGKSNFLELFSEIFYYLEMYHLLTVTDEDKLSKAFGFEIEYYLPLNNIQLDEFIIEKEEILVTIKKPLGKHPEFGYKNNKLKSFRRVDYKSANSETLKLLPKKIIAYTSGQNELLSNPYYKIRYHYFKQLENNIAAPSKSLMDKNRLFFLDYESNFSIFIANMLMANEQNLDYFKKVLAIDGLSSFRITLNFNDYRKKDINIGYRLFKELERLKLCATTWRQENVPFEDNPSFVILDYKITSATIEAFKFHFKNAFELFKVFYEFDTLNLHTVPVSTRNLILKADKSLNLSDELGRVDPSSQVFRIEKIIINKIVSEEKDLKAIYYKSLSDGEHQFSQVIGSVLMLEEPGCLFLFDEPNTHFNPKWRAKMIHILNQITGTNFDSDKKVTRVRQQEIIITTHSPFIISDSLKEDVYKFEKGEFTKPEFQTYGSSIGLLLEMIFERDISISDFSNQELDALKESIKSKEDILAVKKALLRFGESIEKFDAYSYLMEKEEEFNNNKGGNNNLFLGSNRDDLQL